MKNWLNERYGDVEKVDSSDDKQLLILDAVAVEGCQAWVFWTSP